MCTSARWGEAAAIWTSTKAFANYTAVWDAFVNTTVLPGASRPRLHDVNFTQYIFDLQFCSYSLILVVHRCRECATMEHWQPGLYRL